MFAILTMSVQTASLCSLFELLLRFPPLPTLLLLLAGELTTGFGVNSFPDLLVSSVGFKLSDFPDLLGDET